MKLSDLLKTTECISVTPPGKDPEITSVHYDSRTVTPGGLFVAVSGFRTDGHRFISDAVSRGAAAVVVEKPSDHLAPQALVGNARQAMGEIAARFHGYPANSMVMIGITGTNGKTTTSYLVEHILTAAGVSAGVVGTINYRFAGKNHPAPSTTPESAHLQEMLAKMRDAGVTHVVMEVSSHGLELHRLNGCRFDVGVFTNLTQDHLDFHETMDAYWASKKKLFTRYLRNGVKEKRPVAVVNGSDGRTRGLLKELSADSVVTGRSPAFDVHPGDVTCALSGISGELVVAGRTIRFSSPLVGEHNLDNILSAAGVGVSLKLDPQIIKAGIESLQSVPGRLEPVPNEANRFVYVDYAHTPDALDHAVSSLRSVGSGRIITVFGCGGDRDRGKRPKMGKIAASGSDLSVVTSDNPRSEDPMAIIEEILEGVRQSGRAQWKASDVVKGFSGAGFVVEPDRKAAIELAIAASAPDDTILIAGKGHETYQIIGSKTVPFDDVRTAEKAFLNR